MRRRNQEAARQGGRVECCGCDSAEQQAQGFGLAGIAGAAFVRGAGLGGQDGQDGQGLAERIGINLGNLFVGGLRRSGDSLAGMGWDAVSQRTGTID